MFRVRRKLPVLAASIHEPSSFPLIKAICTSIEFVIKLISEIRGPLKCI